ncbi:MAG: hypothetical protein P8L37_00345 [Phycisphaerales bacterium]|nr:hypothetical protein [Phycisphaerales bacterium]
MNAPQNDIQLETLLVATSEFAANAIVVVLADAGIEARAFGSIQGGLGFPLGQHASGWGTPVQVRSCDAAEARRILDQAKQDSLDIDWDAIDIGTFEGTTATPPDGLPIAAKIAFLATALTVLAGLAAAVLMAF